MREFNINGTCFPDQHYMVDIGERLRVMKSLVDDGKYFCINRGRQYGKSTTFEALSDFLKNDYTVLQISFEGVGDAAFETDAAMVRTFAIKLFELVSEGVVADPDGALSSLIAPLAEKPLEEAVAMAGCSSLVGKLARGCAKPVVLLIDEVDQAANHESFLHFLGMLRERFLKRNRFPTFRSVVLAGVYDVKNLKLKVRSEDEHQYNSPWNIAAPFDVDMSLPEQGIAGMLADYENDHHTGMDVAAIARLLRDYTGGYPFLVSRLCQLMDLSGKWNEPGFLDAVRRLLGESNTLFDDLHKKLQQFPSLTDMLRQILYNGRSMPYNYYDADMGLATRLGFVKEGAAQLTVSNRIFETFLYNYFVTESDKKELLFSQAQDSKSIFVKSDGSLDMPLILKRFTETFNEIYGDRGDRFLEDEGRRYFMLYVKPIINGTGNYYIEAETRDALRTDMVIDYLGRQYVVEMKIWRGNAYNERGEEQLAAYLDRFKLKIGYMVSFCFNKDKVPGLREPVRIGDRMLIEAVV